MELYVIASSRVGSRDIVVAGHSAAEAAETFASMIGLEAFNLTIKQDLHGKAHVEFRLGTGIKFICYPEDYRRAKQLQLPLTPFKVMGRKPREGEPGWSTASDAPPGVEG